MNDYKEPVDVGRRDFLRGLAAYASTLALPLAGCGPEDREITTDQAYGDYARAQREQSLRDIETIRSCNRMVRESDNAADRYVAQERLNDLEVDYILQEFPYLQQNGEIYGNTIDMGRYRLEVVEHRGPVLRYTDAERSTDGVRVRIKVYRGEELADLNWLPWKESKTLNLRGKQWTLRKILESESPL